MNVPTTPAATTTNSNDAENRDGGRMRWFTYRTGSPRSSIDPAQLGIQWPETLMTVAAWLVVPLPVSTAPGHKDRLVTSLL